MIDVKFSYYIKYVRMDFREDVLGIIFTVVYERIFSVNVLKFIASELEHVAREV